MALITQQDLIDAASDAQILEKVVSDPADQSNPGHPDGTVTTRLDKTYYNVQAALKGITDFSAALKWEFDDATAMSDPSAGNVRLNNATISSVTSIAISETDAEGADVGDYVNSWADSTDANKGTLVLRSYSGAFAVFTITAITDDTGWVQIDVTYLSGSGSFTIGEAVFAGFSRTGDTGGLTDDGTNDFTGSNTFNGAFALNGAQSETLVATTNNLSLDATSNRLDVGLTGDQTLTGLTGGVDGRIVILRNVDASETLTISNDASGSTAANRFALPAAQGFDVSPNQAVVFQYSSSRWRLICQTFAQLNPYEEKQIGEVFPVLDHITGAVLPDNSNSVKFVKLTSGLTGSGQFNEGLIESEIVTGSAPLVVATANILVGPMAGETINLLNTEGRYIKPGSSSGSTNNDQMQQITGGAVAPSVGGVKMRQTVVGSGAISISALQQSLTDAGGSYFGTYDLTFDSANSPDARTGTYTDVKNVQATYYMRIV